MKQPDFSILITVCPPVSYAPVLRRIYYALNTGAHDISAQIDIRVKNAKQSS